MMECMSTMGPMGWVMGLFWLLLAALIVLGLYRLLTPRDESTPNRESPMETLRRRYAEGELSTEEYEERKRKLREDDV